MCAYHFLMRVRRLSCVGVRSHMYEPLVYSLSVIIRSEIFSCSIDMRCFYCLSKIEIFVGIKDVRIFDKYHGRLY